MFELAASFAEVTSEDMWTVEPFELDIFDMKSDIVELEQRLEPLNGVIDPKVYESIVGDLSYNSARLDHLYSEYQAGRLSKEDLESQLAEVQLVLDRAERSIDMYDNSRR
ncbi:MAG: hypothetical protein AAB439_00105 [Patescibacteria group bacterium]